MILKLLAQAKRDVDEAQKDYEETTMNFHLIIRP